MSNITPTKPSFVFGYWRPWKENSDLFESYLNYSRDTTLVKYGADTVGQYINQASKEQVKAINQLGQAIGKGMNVLSNQMSDIGRGMNVLSNQMSDINETLVFLNRNMDIQIEQQKLSNLLLQNIAEILRVPDSEKERQHSIELGIKFFVNACKDEDLFADALEELLKAESLMKQDYFVLHRIGCIYLYAEKYINPEKALEYFLRAAKYASVESDIKAARLANALTNNLNTVNSDINNSEKQIGLLAADSYEKAAFAAYILGNFSDAVNYQSKALKFNEVAQYRFLLAKYQVRNGEISAGVKNLDQCIDEEPIFAIAPFKEIDLINEPEVLNLISNKNQEIDNEINKLRVRWENVGSTEAANVIKELTELSPKSYEIKISQFKAFEKKANEINKNIGATESEIDAFITQIKKTKFCTLDGNAIQLLIDELLKTKNLPLEKMLEVFEKIKKQVDADRIKIGSKFAGGIVFYIDKSGNHGLVCAEKDFGRATWDDLMGKKVGANEDGISNGHGMRNTRKIVEHASWYIQKAFFSTTKTPAPTAARLCLELNHKGFSDWYLPTKKELELMYQTSEENNLGIFQAHNYWSSTENGNYNAWIFDFNDGYAYSFEKYNQYYVLAVRAFLLFN